MYYEPIDIINCFKKVKDQKIVKKIPKIKKENLEIVKSLTDNFNTKWNNIDPIEYFKCGLKLWKTFSYSKFLNNLIIKEYIKQDKKKKRKLTSKNDIERSFLYLKSISIKSLNELKDDNEPSFIVIEYIKNNIDKILLSYLLFNKYIPEGYINKKYLSYIYNNKKEMKALVKRYSRYIKKLEDNL
jgi:hypothetical protein